MEEHPDWSLPVAAALRRSLPKAEAGYMYAAEAVRRRESYGVRLPRREGASRRRRSRLATL